MKIRRVTISVLVAISTWVTPLQAEDWKASAVELKAQLNLKAFNLCKPYLTVAQGKHYKALAEKRILPIDEINKVVAGYMEAEYTEDTGLEPDMHVSVTLYRACPILFTRKAQDLLRDLEEAIQKANVQHFKMVKDEILDFHIDSEECM